MNFEVNNNGETSVDVTQSVGVRHQRHGTSVWKAVFKLRLNTCSDGEEETRGGKLCRRYIQNNQCWIEIKLIHASLQALLQYASSIFTVIIATSSTLHQLIRGVAQARKAAITPTKGIVISKKNPRGARVPSKLRPEFDDVILPKSVWVGRSIWKVRSTKYGPNHPVLNNTHVTLSRELRCNKVPILELFVILVVR